ncbi:MAG: sodium-dependent transporter [Oscillospiraceae bacterium]|nr:sodium-dependent transporter [Oscillospiraceae bacterium]
MQREHLGSRLGFILLSAGCAIGVGNVWKFPYITGENGGAIFVLIYLFFLVLLGIPVMTMEFAVGRASQKSPAVMHRELEPKGSKWHLHGYSCLAGCVVLMMFYSSVTGWILHYFVSMASGDFVGLSPAQVGETFPAMLSDVKVQLVYTTIVVVIGFLVCSLGLQKGLERVTKYMMLALLAIMVVLAINSVLTPGGSEGLKFYLLPDLNRLLEEGVGKVVVAAMNQAFFTLSLGIGAMAIFGSYLDKERSLLGESLNVTILDTFVAFTSGLIIFPACFAYDVEVGSGPSLIFITLPNVFNNLPGGRFWGSLFFVFMSFAALSTIFTVFECIISCVMDSTGWSRKKTCVICCLGILLLTLPCALGWSVLKGVQPFGEGSTIMDLEDFIVSNCLLPLGSLAFILFCTSRRGWGWKNFTAEANSGKGLKIANWMRFYMTWILPVIVFALFVYGIYDFFN